MSTGRTADTPEPGTGAPISGELVESPSAAVIPSVAEENSAADRARGRTSVQVSVPFAILAITTWLLRLNHVDLDPGAGVDMPAEVAGAWVAIIAVALAWRMNPKTK